MQKFSLIFQMCSILPRFIENSLKLQCNFQISNKNVNIVDLHGRTNAKWLRLPSGVGLIPKSVPHKHSYGSSLPNLLNFRTSFKTMKNGSICVVNICWLLYDTVKCIVNCYKMPKLVHCSKTAFASILILDCTKLWHNFNHVSCMSKLIQSFLLYVTAKTYC